MALQTKRNYRKNARAESEAATRERIVEAVVALHEEIGPARTTIQGIAERAGVQRLTVYRHFPGQPELIAACSSHWAKRNPTPDLSTKLKDPRRRTRELMLRLYRFYRSTERMLGNVIPDAAHMPVVAAHLEPIENYLAQLVAEIERGWRGKSEARHATLKHAVRFETWQSLSVLTGSDEEAAELVARWCDSIR
jgi:AcrR family transcriptional regulator